MKFIKSLIFILIFSLLLIGCSSNPTNTVENFMDSLLEGNTENAIELLADNIQEEEGIEDMMQFIIVILEDFNSVEYEIGEYDISNGNAEVEIKMDATDGKVVGSDLRMEETVPLIKENGDWKIAKLNWLI